MDSISIAARSKPRQQIAPVVQQTDAALHVRWARHHDEVRAAQRLRHEIFAVEMGATLRTPPGAPEGHDIEPFDAFCEHLLVYASAGRGRTPLIGTYRVLTPGGARRAGGLYIETEFDLELPRELRASAAELGRACVHRDWRSGAAILLLWAALADFMQRNRLDTMLGCASVPMHDGGRAAGSLWHRWRATHLAPQPLRARPLLALPVDGYDGDAQLDVEPPALIKGYLRCGAKVLGPPAWDPQFGTADFALLLRLEDVPVRYRQHFLEVGRRPRPPVQAAGERHAHVALAPSEGHRWAG